MEQWTLVDHVTSSRLFVGTALYPSPSIMADSIKASGAEVVTVSIRRENAQKKENNLFWELLKSLNLKLLPNTAGCTSVKEAVTTAQMARELFNTNWIKLELIGDNYSLQPDPFALLEATKELVAQGFEVFPYCTDDLILCEKLVDAGCRIVMPWGAPIGTGRGLINIYALQTLRKRLPDVTLVVDAGIGAPSHASKALEIGFDAVLLNTAIAQANDPIKMAEAFRAAVTAGRLAYEAGLIPKKDIAQPSTPVIGKPFWHQN